MLCKYKEISFRLQAKSIGSLFDYEQIVLQLLRDFQRQLDDVGLFFSTDRLQPEGKCADDLITASQLKDEVFEMEMR